MVGKTACATTVSHTEKRVDALEGEFRSEGIKRANNVVTLIDMITAGTPACIKAVHAARRVLVALEKPARLEETLGKWLRLRRADYGAALLAVLRAATATDEEIDAAVAAAALTHAEVWAALLRAVLRGEAARAHKLVLRSFVQRFGDLRLTALELVRDGEGSVDARLEALRYCAQPVEEEAARGGEAVTGGKELRRAFGAAWGAVVAEKGLLPRQRRDVLERVPQELIPNMADPLKLADFLSDSYNNGRDVSVAVAALHGLFVLISKHGLDYPLFYQKLYGLMSAEALFRAQGRAKFLELAAMVLRHGGMLPGGVVAAFVKRLARRALMAPPEGALWCLRLALDLLRKHPNVSFLVHRAVNLFDAPASVGAKGTKRARGGGEDPYDDDELDPQESGAEDSSLWELEVLGNHVSPAVSRLVIGFKKDVRKKGVGVPGELADYVELTFADIFGAEFKRKAKSSHLAYDVPGEGPELKKLAPQLESFVVWS